MASFGVALPLQRSTTDGFEMVKRFNKLIRQNLKMILLTHPGERVMEPDFGVGLKNYLFQNFHDGVYAEIDEKVRSQVAKYLPVVTITDITYRQSTLSSNRLNIAISYQIPNIGASDLLQVTI